MTTGGGRAAGGAVLASGGSKTTEDRFGRQEQRSRRLNCTHARHTGASCVSCGPIGGGGASSRQFFSFLPMFTASHRDVKQRRCKRRVVGREREGERARGVLATGGKAF